MRRAERDVTSPEAVARIMARARFLCLALHDEPAPYIVPLFFGFEPGRLYIHGAADGTRNTLLKARPQVGFCAVSEAEVVPGETACDFTGRGESVAGTGTARMVENEAEAIHALDLIMAHAGAERPEDGFFYRPKSLARTRVTAIDITRITAKRLG